MSGPFGLLLTGFVPKQTADIVADLDGALQTQFGNSINLSPQARFGQVVGILAERYQELWSLAQELYASLDPDMATGTALANLCALTGTTPLSATASTVTATCTGTPGTILTGATSPVQASVTGTNGGVIFQSVINSTIAAATAWAGTTGYTLGQRRTNSGNIYEVITPGTSAGSGGPSGTGTNITDNTVHWKFIGTGTGFVDVAMACTQVGPLAAPAATLTTIATAISGWNNVYNDLDAVLGRALETDAALRIRREAELRIAGNAALESIRAKVLAAPNVTTVTVFENVTDTTDGNGLPPHSIDVQVQGGGVDPDPNITGAIFASIAAGINTFGSISGTVTDSQGTAHTINYDRPTNLLAYIIVNVIVNPLVFNATSGPAAIKAAIVAFGNTFITDQDLISSAIAAQGYSVPGVMDMQLPLIGTAPAPASSTTINATPRQLFVFDTSRITVNITNGTF